MLETPPPPTVPKPVVRYATDQHALTTPPSGHSQQKKISRRSSKPIINWLQRKLVGTVRPKRGDHPLPLAHTRVGVAKARNHGGRIVSSPLPGAEGSVHRRKDSAGNGEVSTRRMSSPPTIGADDASAHSLIEGRSARWSYRSEADEDASVRPLPPSAPPSPSPSTSSSSYMSDPRTFRSMAASTKPTTLLSVDLQGGGMAHIAQAPLTPTSQIGRIHPHVRNASTTTNTASITFSALPVATSEQTSSRPPSSLLSPTLYVPPNAPVSGVQAPQHTAHHPRNNPRPSSPPLDNASMLTLASSAFAVSGTRVLDPSLHSRPFSALGDSISHFGAGSVNYADVESTSQFVLGDDERALDDRDFDVSVRALRPRSSRRGSWESEASDWSARIAYGSPSIARNDSTWTSPSVKAEISNADTTKPDGVIKEIDETTLSTPPATKTADAKEGTKGGDEQETKDEADGEETPPLSAKVAGLALTQATEKEATRNEVGVAPAEVFHSAPTTPLATPKLRL